MARKPLEFVDHPLSFADAQAAGIVRGYCRNVADGDTFDVLLDLGFCNYAYETVRLHDCDTPEIFSPKSPSELELGVKAQQFVIGALLNKPVALHSFKDVQTFGRFVADVWYWETGARKYLAEELTIRKLTKKDVK